MTNFRSTQNFYRYYFIYAILVIIALVLLGRVSTLHLSKVDNDKTLREKGIYQSIRTVIIKGYRGNIVDRNGDIMALSLPLKNIIIDPEQLVDFLAADFLVQEKDRFISRFVRLIKEDPNIPKTLYHKVSHLLDLKNKVLMAKLSSLGVAVHFIDDKPNPLLSEKVKRLTDDYLNRRIDIIFRDKINQATYQSIAKALNISTLDLQNALKNSPSRKYLKILANISIESSTYKNVKHLLSQKQRIFYKNNRYNNKYFGGAILVESSVKRYYPQAEVSAALLGLTNVDNQGIEGLEKAYDFSLQGRDGKKQMAFSGDKQAFADIKVIQPAKQGQDLVLTIDNNIQYYTYAAIEAIVKEKKAKYGCAIVVNPQGEVLAMVNYPSTNPNNRQNHQPQLYRNRVLLDAIEVGSTMKPFTALFALEKKYIKPDEVLDLTQTIGQHKPDKYSTLTITQVIQKSHNLGILKIGQTLKKAEMWEMLSRLRFGQSSGVMPNMENAGLLRHYKNWYLADKYAISFGYGPMNTTLAQLARAYLVFLNQGYITDLSLVKNQEKPKPEPVFNPSAISEMVKMLDKTVSKKGSGRRAEIEGYEVAGKTGTTRLKKPQGKGYDPNRHSTFFAGFAPVYKPKYLMVVHIYDPQGNYVGGSNVAAPAFKLAMENILKFQ